MDFVGCSLVESTHSFLWHKYIYSPGFFIVMLFANTGYILELDYFETTKDRCFSMIGKCSQLKKKKKPWRNFTYFVMANFYL